MIGYTTVGANDYGKALEFYDTLFGVIGGKRVMDMGDLVLYGFSQGAMFGVIKPYDKKAATCGNGTMIALNVGSKEKVHAVYDMARKLGGADEGPAGPRSDNFYAAYFRDLDGNKLCAFSMG
jgi:predicted enzyme related to lactoylglutathione lyase